MPTLPPNRETPETIREARSQVILEAEVVLKNARKTLSETTTILHRTDALLRKPPEKAPHEAGARSLEVGTAQNADRGNITCPAPRSSSPTILNRRAGSHPAPARAPPIEDKRLALQRCPRGYRRASVPSRHLPPAPVLNRGSFFPVRPHVNPVSPSTAFGTDDWAFKGVVRRLPGGLDVSCTRLSDLISPSASKIADTFATEVRPSRPYSVCAYYGVSSRPWAKARAGGISILPPMISI
jgi:hypothetical protein